MIKINALLFCILLGLSCQSQIKPFSTNAYIISGLALATCTLGASMYHWYHKKNHHIPYGKPMEDDNPSQLEKELKELKELAELEKELGPNLSSQSNQEPEDDEDDFFYSNANHSRLRQWLAWKLHCYHHPRNAS